MYTFRDISLSVLVETIKIAIQECKNELGSVDYETCAKHLQPHLERLKKEHYVLFFVEEYGYYKDALVRIDGYTFNLEDVYDEVMKGENFNSI